MTALCLFQTRLPVLFVETTKSLQKECTLYAFAASHLHPLQNLGAQGSLKPP